MTKTFRQIIDEGYTYPTIIPADLREVIYDWYQDRHVANDDKFALWFSRLLKKEYKHYEQLLRIEPGISDYDWLVTQYREMQRYDNETDSTQDSLATTRHLTVSETVSNNGEAHDTITGQHSETEATEATYTKSESRTKDQDDTTTGSSSSTTDRDSETYDKGDTKTLRRALPMQTLYSGQDPWYATKNISDVLLEWSTATEQDGTGSENRTTESDDTSVSSSNSISFESDVTDRTTGTNTDEKTVSGSGSNSQTKSNTHEDATTKAGTNTNTGSDSRHTSGEREGLSQEVNTGRNGQIAIILENAKQFIENTDAWAWLETRIDTVFMGVYDI